jgi:hypothetical protein
MSRFAFDRALTALREAKDREIATCGRHTTKHSLNLPTPPSGAPLRQRPPAPASPALFGFGLVALCAVRAPGNAHFPGNIAVAERGGDIGLDGGFGQCQKWGVDQRENPSFFERRADSD